MYINYSVFFLYDKYTMESKLKKQNARVLIQNRSSIAERWNYFTVITWLIASPLQDDTLIFSSPQYNWK